jgi:hypothetical protein
VQEPRIIAPRILISTTGDAANANASGIAIENAATQNAIVAQGAVISDPHIVFATGANQVGARQGIKIRIEQDGVGQNNKGTITGGSIQGAEIDILIQTLTTTDDATATGSINDWCITGVEGRGFATFGAFVGEGVSLDIPNFPARPKINRVSIGAPAGTNGVIIGAAGVTNTCVCGVQLTPSGGTAITDNGTGSEITGNVP